jgi:hypothetical protein
LKLQILVTCTFYIFLRLIDICSLVRHVFYYHFETFFEEYL